MSGFTEGQIAGMTGTEIAAPLDGMDHEDLVHMLIYMAVSAPGAYAQALNFAEARARREVDVKYRQHEREAGRVPS